MVELAEEANKALKLEREGKRDEAERLVKASVKRNLPFVSPQAAVEYNNLSTRLKQGLTEAERKQTHWETYKIKRKIDKQKEADQ